MLTVRQQGEDVETCLNFIKNSSLFFNTRFQPCLFTIIGDGFSHDLIIFLFIPARFLVVQVFP
jgi:hypothetical protein